MKNETFIPVTRVKSRPNVTSDVKARVDTGKPTPSRSKESTWTSSSATTTR